VDMHYAYARKRILYSVLQVLEIVLISRLPFTVFSIKRVVFVGFFRFSIHSS
jgi:hypothetical protein